MKSKKIIDISFSTERILNTDLIYKLIDDVYENLDYSLWFHGNLEIEVDPTKKPRTIYLPFDQKIENHAKIDLCICPISKPEINIKFQSAHEFIHVLADNNRFRNRTDNYRSIYEETLKYKRINWIEEVVCRLTEFVFNFESKRRRIKDLNGSRNLIEENEIGWLNWKWNDENREEDSNKLKDLAEYIYRSGYFAKYDKPWNILSNIPLKPLPISEYLLDWHSNMEFQNKKYIKELSKVLGFPLME